MKACDDAGEMVTIDKEVDWNLEVGAISRRICEIGAPMAHMTNIKGVKNGATILGSPMIKGWQNDFARIAIGLEMNRRQITLTIRDDGAGFDPQDPALRSKRLGLTSMRERAESIGGTLQIDSKPGEGTSVRLEVPIG